jgi:hypothetical protein
MGNVGGVECDRDGHRDASEGREDDWDLSTEIESLFVFHGKNPVI